MAITPDQSESWQWTDADLLQFGYAPGNYTIKCFDCKRQVWNCDKRALICKPCAERKLRNTLAMFQGMD